MLYMYIKIINNLTETQGNTTNYLYGGLDINKIISSVIDTGTNVAVAEYVGTELNDNVIEITKEEFDLFCEDVTNKSTQTQQTLGDKINLMQEALDELLLGGI